MAGSYLEAEPQMLAEERKAEALGNYCQLKQLGGAGAEALENGQKPWHHCSGNNVGKKEESAQLEHFLHGNHPYWPCKR